MGETIVGVKNYMQSRRYLSSKPVFVVFVAVFLGCLFLFSRNAPLSMLDMIITPAWLIWVITGVVMLIKIPKYTKKGQTAKKNHTYNRFKNFPFKSSVCFIASILIVIILHEGIALVAREEVKAFLGRVSPDIRVYTEGQPVKNAKQIINALNKITRFQYHGSHSTNEFPIEIVNGDKKLKLVLGRDSRYPQKYWVFYPKYSHTSKNVIGGIKTALFDDY